MTYKGSINDIYVGRKTDTRCYYKFAQIPVCKGDNENAFNSFWGN